MSVVRAKALSMTFNGFQSAPTLVHGGLLGGLITMAPYPIYIWYRGRTQLWGLSALEDQQLAGLLMWVPMGVFYLGACLVLASRLVASQERRFGDAHPSRLSRW